MNIRYWHKKYGEDAPFVINEFFQEKLGPFSIGKKLKYGTLEYFGYVPWIQLGDEEPLNVSSNNSFIQYNYLRPYQTSDLIHLPFHLTQLKIFVQNS